MHGKICLYMWIHMYMLYIYLCDEYMASSCDHTSSLILEVLQYFTPTHSVIVGDTIRYWIFHL